MIQSENLSSLVNLMTCMDNDKVELMGNVMDVKDALNQLGLTEQQFEDFIDHEEYKEHY